MSLLDHPPAPDPILASIVSHVVASLYPWLDPQGQREMALRSLGIVRLAPWSDGRMVYVEAGPSGA